MRPDFVRLTAILEYNDEAKKHRSIESEPMIAVSKMDPRRRGFVTGFLRFRDLGILLAI